MPAKVTSVECNGGLLPDIILLTQSFKCHEEVCFLQRMIPPKRFDIFFTLTGGCSESLGAFRFFLKNKNIVVHN